MVLPEGKKLPRAFDSLMWSKNLAAPYFLQTIESTQRVIDYDAEILQRDYQMKNRFCEELMVGNGFSPEVTVWGFGQMTGIELTHQSQRKTTGIELTQQPLAQGMATDLPRTDKRMVEDSYKLLMDGLPTKALLEGWKMPKKSKLQQAIEKSSGDSEVSLLGGGLPPANLIMELFLNVYIPSLKKFISEFVKEPMKKKLEIIKLLQYPPDGGADSHREVVIDHFLRASERDTIIKNFTEERRAKGLFFTYGSQEAISMMIKSLIDQEHATTDSPVEIAVTDPTYPGLLMAADEFLSRGLLKFRLVPLDEKTGQIDTQALDSALSKPRCKAFYLAEGNPVPKKIFNLGQVAQVLDQHKDKLVYDDHAYDGLGATTENTLFDLLPNRVISFKTLSKKISPIRVGFVYSNMDPEKFDLIRESMLRYQYNATLGYSGVLSRTVVDILELDAKGGEKGVLKEHIKKAQAYYEKQRQLYAATYKEAFDLAFGPGNYNFDDEVIIGDEMFMFGWRSTKHVPADKYADAGEEIKLVSVSGTGCKPQPEYIVGEQYRNSQTNNRLRQNYTWPDQQKLRIGILKDVLLEVVFSESMTPEQKGEAVLKLYEKMKEINDNKDLKAVQEFIERMAKSNYKYTKKAQV